MFSFCNSFREDDVSDVRLHVIPVTRTEKVLRQLTEDGYDVGPSPSAHLHLREGDLLEINFRGNITCRDDGDAESLDNVASRPGPITLVYNSHLGTSVDFGVREVDCFLQKNYNVYRGFVQVFREVRTTCQPTKADQEEGRTLPWVEISKDLVTELLITIPKVRSVGMVNELLITIPMVRSVRIWLTSCSSPYPR